MRRGMARRVHTRRLQNRLQVGSALALGVGLLLTALLFSGWLEAFQARLSDFLYQPRAPSGQVVIIAIDDASLAELGPWPWPRATLADLINALAPHSPRVLALALVLSDPSTEFTQSPSAGSGPVSSADDLALAQALPRVPHVVQPIVGVEATRFPPRVNALPRFDVALGPAPALQTPNTTLAHAMIVPDADGVVRRLPVAIDAAGRRYPALGIAALALYQNRALELELTNGRVALGTTRLPVDAYGQMRLNFGSPKARRVLSFADALRGRVDLAPLRDKIVLIGITSAATPQSYETPLSFGSRHAYPVEIQADLIETLLGGYLLIDQDRLVQITMIFLMALLAGATLPHARWLSAAALTLIYFLVYLGYAFQEFNDGVVVQPLYPALALFLTFALAMTFRHFAEERPRAFIGRLFRRSVAPEAVDQVLAVFDQGVLALGGVRRKVSVLYVDLRDFAALAEVLAPEGALTLLNRTVAQIVASIFRYDGSIARHTGDTLLAVWNLPLEQCDHASRAVRAAVEIQHEFAHARQSEPKELTFAIGLGIATGRAVAGHLGTSARGEYTLIGEIVTIAERLALKPDRGVFIDAATREQIGAAFETRAVNPVRLRRKSDPLDVWEVCAPMELEEGIETRAEVEE